MAIESIGSSRNLIKNFEADNWLKKSDFELSKSSSSLDSGDIESVSKPDNRMNFSEMLAKSLGEVNGLQQEADVAMQKLASGESQNIQETMLAVERADIAFKTMNQIRSKVIDAYKEVMRMQL